jgi:hypothetical protein
VNFFGIVLIIIAVIVILNALPFVFVFRLENKIFTFKLKYLAATVFYLKIDENFKIKMRVFFVPVKRKKKKSEKDENSEKLSWDERVRLKSEEIQRKAYAKIDELNSPPKAKTVDSDISDNLKKSKNSKKKRRNKDKLKIQLALLKSIVRSSGRILRVSKVKDLNLNFIITDPDAADCAIKYGCVNAAVYNVLGVVTRKVRVKFKKIFIDCSYKRSGENAVRESVYDGSFKFKVTSGVILFCLINLVSDIVKVAKV